MSQPAHTLQSKLRLNPLAAANEPVYGPVLFKPKSASRNFFLGNETLPGKNERQVLDASRKNGLSSIERVGKYDNSVYDWEVEEIWATNEDDGTVNLIDLDRPGIYGGDTIDVFATLMGSTVEELARFSGDRELILVIGEHEIEINTNSAFPVTLDNTEFLSELAYEDYLTISLIQNNDSHNILWEFGFVINGLHVYSPIPGEFEELKPLEPMDGSKQRVRTLGGMRLRYEYHPPINTEIVKVTWKFQHDGYYCKQPGADHNDSAQQCEHRGAGVEYVQESSDISDQNNCDVVRCGIWWEPADNSANTLWSSNLVIENNQYVAETRSSFSSGSIIEDIKDRYAIFDVVAREIGPEMAEPKGNDIVLLESLLWQLGRSPTYSTQGTNYRGIAAIRKVSDRNVFDVGCPVSACSVNESTPPTKSTMEMMVWRFKYQNEVDGNYAGSDLTISNHAVNDATLGKLKENWEDYLQAYVTYKTTPVVNGSHTQYQDWLTQGAAEWDSNSIYPLALHNLIMTEIGSTSITRESILDAWIDHESSRRHWGQGTSPYRVVVGATDSWGSIGFHQIQSRYIWGVSSSGGCTAMQGQNLYDPVNGARAITWWGETGCGFTMREAMSRFYLAAYDNSATDIKIRQSRNVNSYWPSTILSQTQNYVETPYEDMSKGIAGYNQGVGWAQQNLQGISWPALLRDIDPAANTNTRKGLRYAIEIKREAGLHLRSYLWHDTANDVCFWYGEEDWVGNQSWQTVYNTAQSQNVGGGRRVSCQP